MSLIKKTRETTQYPLGDYKGAPIALEVTLENGKLERIEIFRASTDDQKGNWAIELGDLKTITALRDALDDFLNL